MATSPTPITALPTPPSRSDPTNFAARGDAFLGALPAFVTQTNNLATNAYNNALDSESFASNSATSATNAFIQSQAAALSAAASAASAGAVKWISGTTYTEGAVTWSPLNFLSYRRKATGGGTTDPSSDLINWALVGAPSSFPITVISTNTSALLNNHYILATSLELTLPASPGIGTPVQFTDISNTRTCKIKPGVEKIRGVAEDMVINSLGASGILVYSGSTYGWV